MSAVIKPKKNLSITPRMVALGPYEMYCEQVRGVTEAIRSKAQGLTYLPAQFGGLKGQRISMTDQVVVQVIDFENNQ